MTRLPCLPSLFALLLVGCAFDVGPGQDPAASAGDDSAAALDEYEALDALDVIDEDDLDAFGEDFPEEELLEESAGDEPFLDEDEEEPLDEPFLDSVADDELEGALYAALQAGAREAPVQRNKVFRVLNWNIAGGKENACRPDLIRRAVMRMVRETNGAVDFISLNEVCPAQYQAIRDALGRRWNKGADDKFSAFVRGGGSRVGNAIFSRRNLRAIHRIKVGEDRYGDRYLLCGLQQGRRVRVCSAHLTPADPKARTQLKRVMKRLERWWTDKGDTVILAGDLNLTADDRGLNAVYAKGANSRANPNNHGKYREWDDKDPVCKGYGERTLTGATSGPCGKGRKIDFVFARRNRIVNGNYSADTLNIPRDCTGVCSDHRAIRGRAKLKFLVE